MKKVRLIGIGVLVALCGCAGTFQAYEGFAIPDAELAILSYGYMDYVSVTQPARNYYNLQRDGRASSIKLKPGTYSISYSTRSYATTGVSHTNIVALVAGHIYRVREYACYKTILEPGCLFNSKIRDRYTYAWLEDETTGQVLGGEPPPF